MVVILATTFMWFNRVQERTHDYAKVVPQNDPDFVDYQAFKNEFGDDGNVLIIAIKGDIFERKAFTAIYEATEGLSKFDWVTHVISIANIATITADQDNERFEVQNVVSRPPVDDAEMDSIRKIISTLPFYKGLIINDSLNTTLIGVTLDAKRLDTEEKATMVYACVNLADEILKKAGMEPHYSGLPYVRAFVTDFIPKEMVTFLLLAVLVMAIFLYITFRSIYAVIIPLIVIGVVIVWALGMMGLFDYKITILTAVLPALIAVIGVPNSIYLITKYHFEYKRTQNKIKSLVLVIQKIGIVTVMTNATTAVGFGVLAFTQIQILKEFGILAGLSVVVTFFVSLLLIPIFFSFLPAPGHKQIRHTERRLLYKVIQLLNFAVLKRRWLVYTLSILLTGGAFLGMYQLKPRSMMVDDLPKEGKVIADLEFLESQFSGVMPFEVVVNTHRKRGIMRYKTLKSIDTFQERLKVFPEISRSVSVLDLIKFSRQALLSGVEKEYQIPSREEFLVIQSYVRNSAVDSLVEQTTIFDSTYSKARIKANIKDVGSIRLTEIIDSLETDLYELFVVNTKSGKLKENERYKVYGTDSFSIQYKDQVLAGGDYFTTDTTSTYEVLSGEGKVDYADRVKITGTTKIFVKSNEYLIRNLIQSLVIAFFVIAVLMALLFGSVKMVITALIPNLLPLLLTGGIMGFTNIPLKPSTALIFSVAFGIAVDDTIHYLARYRLARKSGDGVKEAVSNSFQDTGVSMIYTSIILFFGFVIFAFSSYGGTQALGQLTSITLLIALFTNLLLLPSLLVTLNKDDDKEPDGVINYEEEEQEVEAIREFLKEDDG